MSNRFSAIAYGLTALTAVLAVVVGTSGLPGWTVAVSGVLAGLWWGFGRKVLPDAGREYDESHRDRDERQAERDARRRHTDEKP